MWSRGSTAALSVQPDRVLQQLGQRVQLVRERLYQFHFAPIYLLTLLCPLCGSRQVQEQRDGDEVLSKIHSVGGWELRNRHLFTGGVAIQWTLAEFSGHFEFTV